MHHLTRRTFLKHCAAGAATLALGQTMAGAAAASGRPNIILILADDLSAKELSGYGGRGIATPNLEALARAGVLFQTCWTVPLCGPSRATLETGQYPFQHKFFDNAILSRQPLWARGAMLGRTMRRAGYATAMFGKLHHGGDPQRDYGFDEYAVVRNWPGYDGPNQGMAGMYEVSWYWHPGLVENGKGVPTGPGDFGPELEVDRLNDFVRRHRERPFFAYWTTNLPHMAHTPGNPVDSGWVYTAVPETDAQGRPTGRRTAGSLKSTVECIDRLIGRIRQNLEAQGLLENTIVIFTADNGTAGYGKNLPESEVGPRVPFIVSGPGWVKPRGPCAELIDFSDVLPTLAELGGAGLPPGYVCAGHSFAPLLLGRPFQGREWIFTQLRGGRWLRDKRWLLDAAGRLWDCGNSRDETRGYKDVTDSTDPQVLAARRRFAAILKGLPAMDPNDPELRDLTKPRGGK